MLAVVMVFMYGILLASLSERFTLELSQPISSLLAMAVWSSQGKPSCFMLRLLRLAPSLQLPLGLAINISK